MAGWQLDAATADPADGRIERDADGEPNGALQEGAADLVSRLLPDTSDADWDAALATALKRALYEEPSSIVTNV